MERIAKQEKCVIYSFGINGKSSFEAALLERAQGCEVWGYDFTMDPEDSLKYCTLDAFMKLNGHTFIDLLKNDVEGPEFDTLTAFLATHKLLSPFSNTTLPIGQLQIELHAWDDYGKFDLFHDWWAARGGRPEAVPVRIELGVCELQREPLVAVLVRGNHSLGLRGSRRSRR
ncbi:hypothetical protein EDB83DRAFT_2431078, partial [Lactarius deliciosus]